MQSRSLRFHCNVMYRYLNAVQHKSLVLILCAQHLRGEHIGIVLPVVMEMFRRVHQKFTPHYSLILPPIGRQMLLQPMQKCKPGPFI